MIKEIRERHEAVVLVDGGDMFDLKSNPVKHRYIVRGMRDMQYDAINIGDQDLTEGADFLREQASEAALPLISATVTSREATWNAVVPPFRIIEQGGLRLGIIGSGMTDSFRFLTGAQQSGLSIAENYDPLKRRVKTLRRTCDLIVVLSHAGLGDNTALAKAVDDIDLIIGAHTQIRTDEPVLVGQTRIVQAGKNSEHLGMITLTVQNGVIQQATNRLIPLDDTVPADPDMQALADEYLTFLERERSRADIPQVKPVAECASCHAEQTMQWQTTAHAHAFDTLVRQGKTDNPECLTCHVTPGGHTEEGIQCLTCHATPVDHGRPGIPTRVAAIQENLCRTCHTRIQSPGFEFETQKGLVTH